jgi:hypothetical protein
MTIPVELTARTWQRLSSGVLLGTRFVDDTAVREGLRDVLADGPDALTVLLTRRILNLSPAIDEHGQVVVIASVVLDEPGGDRSLLSPFARVSDADLGLTPLERAGLAQLAETLGNVSPVEIPDVPPEG